jgi:hypothetical protein
MYSFKLNSSHYYTLLNSSHYYPLTLNISFNISFTQIKWRFQQLTLSQTLMRKLIESRLKITLRVENQP